MIICLHRNSPTKTKNTIDEIIPVAVFSVLVSGEAVLLIGLGEAVLDVTAETDVD